MLICKKCGYKQNDFDTINFIKKRFLNIDEHNIPYYCGACVDNATNEEYENMMAEMENPEFVEAVKTIASDLGYAVSYDEWAAREYGECNIDIDDTARNLAEMGYRKIQDGYRKEEDTINEILHLIDDIFDNSNAGIINIRTSVGARIAIQQALQNKLKECKRNKEK